MELESRTKDELKILINSSASRTATSILEQALEIINADSITFSPFKLKYTTRKSIFYTQTDSPNIYYNSKSIENKTNRLYQNSHKKFTFSYDELFIYLLIFGLTHELSHLLQFHNGSSGLYSYQDLNNLYAYLMNYIQNITYGDELLCKIFHDNYFHERNANIYASRLCAELFEGREIAKYAKMVYFNVLFLNSYKLKNGIVTSPVERTMQYMHIKHYSSYGDVPFDIAFDHGLPINPEQYHYIYDSINERMQKHESIKYEETMERLQKLTLESKGVSTDK